MKNFTCIDLFCGAGGLSKGFLDAGFDVLLGVDSDTAALKTFEQNHGQAKALNLDLFDHKNLDLIQQYLNEINTQPDVLIGGPPCQGFSLAGNREKDDKRNILYTAMVQLAEIIKPQAIILENVPGLLQLHNGYGYKKILNDFQQLGYNVNSQILFAPDYGIPQIRKRIFFVCLHRSSQKYIFPAPTHQPDEYITCEEAISDLPALEGIYGNEIQTYEVPPLSDYQIQMRKNSSAIYNHIGTIHNEKTLKFISMIPEGKNYKALPEKYKGIYKYHEALTRYHSKKPALTINTCHRSHFHYKWNRIPTVRESARLQSFPDNFIFYGTKAEQYKQVGNAVPPLLGKAIAEELKKYL